MLSTIVTWVLVVAFVAAVVSFFVVQSRRMRMQRVVLDGSVLSTTDPITGRLNGLRVDRIGTVVYLPERHSHVGEGANGIWTWGGILILDTDGKVVRQIVRIPGSELPMSTIAEQIPAPRHERLEAQGEAPYRRAEFLRQFPHALRAFQLRGATWMSIVIVLVVVIGVTVVIGIGAFVGAVLTALTP